VRDDVGIVRAVDLIAVRVVVVIVRVDRVSNRFGRDEFQIVEEGTRARW
jgi:hypothetical protein